MSGHALPAVLPAAARVLVVDDEEPIRELVRGYLAREQFGVLTAGDGITALELVRHERPDVVILDLNLPGVDGIEVCRQLRIFSDAYVLMLTARSDEIDRIVGLSIGADDYLVKPFSPRELVARVPRGCGIAPREEDAEAREVRERRPHLLPVHDEVAVLLARARANSGEIGASFRLRETLAPDLLRGQDRGEVARLLLLGAMRHDRRPGHAEADHTDVWRCLCPRHLFEEDRLVRIGSAAAAVLLRPGETGVASVVECAAPGAHLGPVEASRAAAVPLELVGEVLLDPGAELAPESGFFGGVAQIHLCRC